VPQRKSFMAGAKRSSDREAQREAVGTLFNNAGELADSRFAAREVRSQNLPVARIHPNPFQARRDFSNLDELADAIRVQGFTTRLRVRPDPSEAGYFQLVYGERRLRAAELTGLAAIPCDIAEHSDEEMIEIGLAENIQRRDLVPLEEAMAFRTLIDQRGYSIRKLAERIGKDKGYVENRLALLNTPEDVRHMVTQRPDSVRAAREIAKLPDPEDRRALIEGIVAGTLTDRDIRAQVHAVKGGASRGGAAHRSQQLAPEPVQPSPIHAVRHEALSLDQDVHTVQDIVRRWSAALEQGQITPAVLAQAMDALDTTLAPLRALFRKDETTNQ
jgi:ParB family transcriptional regulator, chromosome partitioning protein